VFIGFYFYIPRKYSGSGENLQACRLFSGENARKLLFLREILSGEKTADSNFCIPLKAQKKLKNKL
jgi:hypothetical protein